MSVVRYAFKNSTVIESLTFDGPHITLAEFKRQLKQRVGPTAALEFRVTNEHTGEVYANESDQIQRNSSVVVARVPLTKQQQEQHRLQLQLQQASSSHAAASVAAPMPFSATSTEQERLKQMSDTVPLQPAAAGYVKGVRGIMGRPGPDYVCHRCKEKGHFISQCPTNGDPTFDSAAVAKGPRYAVGIPRTELEFVDDPDLPGVMIDHDGRFVVRKLPQTGPSAAVAALTAAAESADDAATPAAFQCPLCRKVMKDAAVTPCCAKSFCDECVRDELLERFECPGCGSASTRPTALVPNIALRQAILQSARSSSEAALAAVATAAPVQLRGPPPGWKPFFPPENLPAAYCCNRCLRQGHHIRDCPLQWDPALVSANQYQPAVTNVAGGPPLLPPGAAGAAGAYAPPFGYWGGGAPTMYGNGFAPSYPSMHSFPPPFFHPAHHVMTEDEFWQARRSHRRSHSRSRSRSPRRSARDIVDLTQARDRGSRTGNDRDAPDRRVDSARDRHRGDERRNDRGDDRREGRSVDRGDGRGRHYERRLEGRLEGGDERSRRSAPSRDQQREEPRKHPSPPVRNSSESIRSNADHAPPLLDAPPSSPLPPSLLSTGQPTEDAGAGTCDPRASDVHESSARLANAHFERGPSAPLNIAVTVDHLSETAAPAALRRTDMFPTMTRREAVDAIGGKMSSPVLCGHESSPRDKSGRSHHRSTSPAARLTSRTVRDKAPADNHQRETTVEDKDRRKKTVDDKDRREKTVDDKDRREKTVDDKDRREKKVDDKNRREKTVDDKDRRETTVEGGRRRERTPEDKGRREKGVDGKDWREKTADDKHRRETTADDKHRREKTVDDKDRREKTVDDKDRREKAVDDKDWREKTVDDKDRREKAVDNKHRREKTADDKHRRETTANDHRRREKTREDQHRRETSPAAAGDSHEPFRRGVRVVDGLTRHRPSIVANPDAATAAFSVPAEDCLPRFKFVPVTAPKGTARQLEPAVHRIEAAFVAAAGPLSDGDSSDESGIDKGGNINVSREEGDAAAASVPQASTRKRKRSHRDRRSKNDFE